MSTTDPEQERLRLAGVYAGQTDGELEQTAAEAGALTDIAREALRAEMKKRGLVEQSEAQSGDLGEFEFRDLVTVRSFWNLAEANMAKGVLDAASIESFLFDENVVGLAWYVNAVHGVKLRVDKHRAEEADRLLRDYESEALECGDPESTS